MRRERLEQVGRLDERLVAGEDYDFYLRACRAGLVAFADIADTRVQVGTHDRLSTFTQLPVARRTYRLPTQLSLETPTGLPCRQI